VTGVEFLAVIRELFGDGAWPPPLHVVKALERIRAGEDRASVRRDFRIASRTLTQAEAAADPVVHLLGARPEEASEEVKRRARATLGQLLLGRCAELAFENQYRREMGSERLELRDLRESRSDTDYRLYDESDRPLYRINIKFHGARFRRALEFVGLEPDDCFALATYKIHSALIKQEEEHLPYFFAIVGVRGLSGEAVGASMPGELTEAAAVAHSAPRFKGKRDFEDRIVRSLVSGGADVFRTTYEQIEQAQWFLLSARRAEQLLRQMLFERVFALRVRGFAQTFRAAELDMHFSLSQDLTPLQEFFATLRQEGLTKVATQLERGII